MLHDDGAMAGRGGGADDVMVVMVPNTLSDDGAGGQYGCR